MSGKESSTSQKKGNKALALILVAGGAVVVLMLCCGVGIAGYLLYRFSGPDIVGRWEADHMKWEFKNDGTGTNQFHDRITIIEYRLQGSELTVTPKRELYEGKEKDLVNHRPFRYRVRLQGDALFMETIGEDERGTLQLRRAK